MLFHVTEHRTTWLIARFHTLQINRVVQEGGGGCYGGISRRPLDVASSFAIPTLHSRGPGVPSIELVHNTIQDGSHGCGSDKRRGVVQPQALVHPHVRGESLRHPKSQIQRDWREVIIETRFSAYGCARMLCIAQHTVGKQRPYPRPNTCGLPPTHDGRT